MPYTLYKKFLDLVKNDDGHTGKKKNILTRSQNGKIEYYMVVMYSCVNYLRMLSCDIFFP